MLLLSVSLVNHSVAATQKWRITMKYLALVCLLFKSIACLPALGSAEDLALFDNCPIIANWRGVFSRTFWLVSIIKLNIFINIFSILPSEGLT